MRGRLIGRRRRLRGYRSDYLGQMSRATSAHATPSAAPAAATPALPSTSATEPMARQSSDGTYSAVRYQVRTSRSDGSSGRYSTSMLTTLPAAPGGGKGEPL